MLPENGRFYFPFEPIPVFSHQQAGQARFRRWFVSPSSGIGLLAIRSETGIKEHPAQALAASELLKKKLIFHRIDFKGFMKSLPELF